MGGGLYANDPNAEMEDMIKQQKAEAEQKRQNLYKTHLEIYKSQGAQNWLADRSSDTRSPVKPSLPGFDN